jgi:hypothetical protein
MNGNEVKATDYISKKIESNETKRVTIFSSNATGRGATNIA